MCRDRAFPDVAIDELVLIIRWLRFDRYAATIARPFRLSIDHESANF
jgi:hypothetical protein